MNTQKLVSSILGLLMVVALNRNASAKWDDPTPPADYLTIEKKYDKNLYQNIIPGSEKKDETFTNIIRNFIYKDSLGADNKFFHSATFELDITSAVALSDILRELQNAFQSNIGLTLVFAKTGVSRGARERTYTNTFIREISFPPLDGNSRYLIKAKIKIDGGSVSTANNTEWVLKMKPETNIKRSLSSCFMMRAASLPTNRIGQISALNITNAKSVGQDLIFEMFDAFALPWEELFLSRSADNKSKKFDVQIELLDPSLRDIIGVLDLKEVEIISYNIIARTAQQELGRVRIGLRVKNVKYIRQ